MTSNSYDLFISYNSAQLDQGVSDICNYLKKWFNLNIWFDEIIFNNNNNETSVREFDALQSSLIFICFPSKEYKKKLVLKI